MSASSPPRSPGCGLLQALGEDDLKLLVLFSSSTGRFGRKGQVDYAVANEVLNKLAQQQARQRPGCRVVSVNWGPWDGGMVTPALKKVFEQEQVAVIPLAAGATTWCARSASRGSAGGSGRAGQPTGGFHANVPRRTDCRAVQSPDGLPIRPTVIPAATLTCAFERELDRRTLSVVAGARARRPSRAATGRDRGVAGPRRLHANPGLTFHGFDALRVLKGVILSDDQACRLRVLAGKAAKHEGLYRVPVELRSLTGDDCEVLHARADILLAASVSRVEGPVPEIALRPYWRSASEIYQELLFHGPALQGIEEVEGCSEQGIAATVKAAPRRPSGSNNPCAAAGWPIPWRWTVPFSC